jgi:hypothetical protein
MRDTRDMHATHAEQLNDKNHQQLNATAVRKAGASALQGQPQTKMAAKKTRCHSHAGAAEKGAKKPISMADLHYSQ